MLAKRIIPCLDVYQGQVVKGIQFRNHKIIGDIIPLVKKYLREGADELVFYDINASCDNKILDKNWISRIARIIDIPFCVSGGIKSIPDASNILSAGADKISINSPALNNPELINLLSDRFGTKCVVIGIDSWFDKQNNKYKVCQYTGNEKSTVVTNWETMKWVKEVQLRGAGEIVLNMMNHDGTKQGYDIEQIQKISESCNVPLIASGGAGTIHHFLEVFKKTKVSGALAASVFHKNIINISFLKNFLINKGVIIRKC